MNRFESIAGCMLAISLALRMLPDKKYEQSVRLFTGFLLLLLFLQPLLRIGPTEELMEEKLAQLVEEQEAVERQIFKESEGFRAFGREEETTEKKIEEVRIDQIEVEVSGND